MRSPAAVKLPFEVITNLIVRASVDGKILLPSKKRITSLNIDHTELHLSLIY